MKSTNRGEHGWNTQLLMLIWPEDISFLKVNPTVAIVPNQSLLKRFVSTLTASELSRVAYKEFLSWRLLKRSVISDQGTPPTLSWEDWSPAFSPVLHLHLNQDGNRYRKRWIWTILGKNGLLFKF